jgi:phosphatidate cytidylyltransferase
MTVAATIPARAPSELGKRVATGVIGGGVLVALIVFGGWMGIFLVTTVVSLGMIHEFARITFSLPDETEKRYALLSVAWFTAVAMLIAPRSEFEIAIACFLALFAYFLFTAKRHEGEAFARHFHEVCYAYFGVIYLALVPQYLPLIHESVFGVQWTMLFLLIVWAGDTGAYFAGKKYGRTKLYPVISPKKTVEGAIGGLAAGFVVSVLFKLVAFREMGWAAALLIPLVVGAVAQIGDLCESFLKRAFDKKDSGSILPGHGGFLDRFDGVVFSLPVMYACIKLFS